MTLLISLIMGLFGDILGGLTGGLLDIGSTGLNILGSSMLQSDAQDFQRDEWTRQFYMSNQRQDELIRSQREYESPAAYIERLRKVGINPAALLQTGGSLLGQQVPNSVNTPGSVTSPHFVPSDIGFGQHIEAFGNFVKAIADAKKSGLDSELLRQTFDDNVRLLREKVFSQQLENVNRQLDNYVNNEIKNVKVKHAFKQYDFLCTLEQNARFLGENVKADTSLKAAKELLTIAEKELSEQQYQELSIIVRNKQSMINSEITKNYASAAAFQASASESYAHAALFKEETGLRAVERAIAEGTKDEQMFAQLDKLAAQQFNSQKEAKEAYLELERLKKIASAYENSDFLKKIDAAMDHLKERFPAIINMVLPK